MRRLPPLLVILSLVLVAGCGKGNFSQSIEASKGNVFHYPIPNTPTTMDPDKVQDGDTIDLLQQTYEGLVGWSTKNEVEPRIAKNWDVSTDGTLYTFHLRKGVKFFNGREVTADDFKWCIERACNPKYTSETADTYLNNIVGVSARLGGKAAEVSGIKVVDPYTLTIQIDKPRPYFVDKLTYPVAFVFAKEALKDPLADMKDVSEMIGSGPFKVSQILPDQKIILTANKDYWNGAPKIDGIERPIVKDASTALNMFKAGQVDLVNLQRQDVAGLLQDPVLKSELHYYDRPAIWYLGLNQGMVPVFKDRRVRQAFAMAIDSDKIVNSDLGGINKVAQCILPPGVFGHRDKANYIPYDPAEAKKLLAQAGYPDGKNFPDLELTFREQRPDIRIVAEAASQMLKENLGINVTLRTMEWKAYLDKNTQNKLPFFHMRWAADYLDAENFLSTLLASYGPENHVGYHNPQFDALCQAADTSLDPEKRKQLYAQAEDIALQDAPFIPIYFQQDVELINPRVSGLRDSLFGHLPHTTVQLK
jgi:oligopeptide transport system substrate-binding protein